MSGGRGASSALTGLIALACFFGPLTAAAHDLGVARVRLTETAPGQYVLTARLSSPATHEFRPPELPTVCRFTTQPPSTAQLAAGTLRYEFAAEGGLSAGDTILLPWPRDGALVTSHWHDGRQAVRFFARQVRGIPIELAELQAGSGSFGAAATRYTALGVEHILLGVDHLLFVLGLMLLVEGGWALVKTITAFTLAHSITLALATLGLVRVPSGPVEAVIALSIVFLAVEIVHQRQGRRGLTVRFPWIVAFIFGLLHGLGFAGALSALGLPAAEIPAALLFFNVGVELGQLIFVFAFLALRWSLGVLEVKWPAWAGPLPAYAIGALAMFWLIERTVSTVGA